MGRAGRSASPFWSGDNVTGGGGITFRLLQLLLKVFERVGGSVDRAPTKGSNVLEPLHLVFEDELVARNLLDEVANLLGHERADAEDDREREHDHHEYGGRVRQPGPS